MNVIELEQIGNTIRAGFECPGCQYKHYPTVKLLNGTGPVWNFNNDLEKPTFSPSIRVKGEFECHSFVKNGEIQFLNDCTHHLAGKTVKLEKV